MINVLIYAGALFFQPQAYDSLGIETVNGKVFVVHRVEEKETLYGISKRYGTTVDAIVQYNPDVAAGLDKGQILKVPYTKPVTNRTTTTTTTPTAGRGGVIHVVAARETMFSISKAYGVTVDELKQWNNLTDNTLTTGQELVIKRRNTTASETVAPVAPTTSASGKGVHTVEAKETLFSIATKHGISVQQLKDWNHLTSNEISIGQTLAVKQPAAHTTPDETRTPSSYTNTTPTTTTPVTTTPTTTTPVKHDPPVVTEPPREKTEPVVVKQPSTEQKPTTIRISESVKNSDEIMEAGLAELIEGTEGNRKYLALHRTAPVGTILKIKNEMNNREVFVRVMGKLPDTAMTDKLIIKISKSAYDRLGAIDARFRVEVTYYK